MTVKNQRITVNFSDGAIDWLNREAKKHNLSVSELLRRIVDELRGSSVLKKD